jgi:hypothetical protein
MLAGAARPFGFIRSIKANYMATKKQTAANRRNARKSTGPKTTHGKAASSANALVHGLRARKVVMMEDEDPQEFSKLLAGLQNQYQPQTQTEQDLVDQAALAQWKMARTEVFEDKCYKENPTPAACAAIFDRMTQIACRLERSYAKACRELERLQAIREKQAEQARQPQPSAAKPDKRCHNGNQPLNYERSWTNSDGEREVLFRAENGKSVDEFSGASPTEAKPPAPPV